MWGPNVWVELSGHASAEPEAVRDLYALAAAQWVDEGRTAHYAVAPATDPALIDAWFRLGFGQQHVHAIREAPATPLTDGIARPDDAAHLGFAVVLEDARGAGVGKTLGTTVLDWASAEGYRAVVTDWRATNLLSSRTWPKLGFRPTFFRLFRAVT